MFTHFEEEVFCLVMGLSSLKKGVLLETEDNSSRLIGVFTFLRLFSYLLETLALLISLHFIRLIRSNFGGIAK